MSSTNNPPSYVSSAFRLYIKGNTTSSPDFGTEDYKEAEKAAQRLADATGLPVTVWPDLERYALIPNWTAYPKW